MGAKLQPVSKSTLVTLRANAINAAQGSNK